MAQEKRRTPATGQILNVFVKFNGKPRKKFEELIFTWMVGWYRLIDLKGSDNTSDASIPQEILRVKKAIKETKLEIDQIRVRLRKTYTPTQVSQLFIHLTRKAQQNALDEKVN